jgi:hypothetical protein
MDEEGRLQALDENFQSILGGPWLGEILPHG